MHVREVVEDVFDIGFFLQLKWPPVYQSVIFDHVVKQNDVHMYTIMRLLCVKYERNRSIHV